MKNLKNIFRQSPDNRETSLGKAKVSFSVEIQSKRKTLKFNFSVIVEITILFLLFLTNN